MSQTLASATARAGRTAGARPGGAPAQRPSPARTPLRVVQAPRTSGSPLGFAMICAALLGAGLISLLLLNTAVAQDSFGLQRLQTNSQQLADQEQALAQSNDLAAAPAQLSAKAWALGLVPASGTAFVQLPSGKVLGVANPAPRVKPPTVITSNNRTTGTSGGSTAKGATGTAAAPGNAPAAPVSRTAATGAAPGLAPAAPAAKSTTGTNGTTGTTKTKGPKTPPTTTR